MRARLLTAAALCAAVLGACGSDSDSKGSQSIQELCNSYVDTLCNRYYDCLSETQRSQAGLPATVAACKSEYRSQAGCEAADENGSCEGNEVFHRNEAETCIKQWGSASCGQLIEADTEADFAPACDRVCTVE